MESRAGKQPVEARNTRQKHSFQSIAFTLIWVAVIVSTRLLRDQTGVVATVMAGAWVVFFITWILLMIKAYHGRTFKLPLIGSLASRWAG